ncbi:zinc ribbon domain-containing protein [Rossellomorea marisflavi]|uniref:zinc ribbon domain-containing protein n=1 Tax=Rossellomorea marisflavi TaxID=189381 RepID=UPI0040446871
MVTCPNCHHQNDDGNFCEKCGTRLTEGEPVVTGGASAASIEAARPNEHLEKAKNVSKLYFGYFMGLLKSPLAKGSQISEGHFVNGLITIILYSLILPLSMYAGIGEYGSYIDSPFLSIVIKPALTMMVFVFLISVFTFCAVKVVGLQVSFKSVVARFGALLVPFITIFALGLLMALFGIYEFVFVLALGLFGAIFTVPAIVVMSYTRNITTKFDPLYGIILTYVASFIVFALILRGFIMNMVDSLGIFSSPF